MKFITSKKQREIVNIHHIRYFYTLDTYPARYEIVFIFGDEDYDLSWKYDSKKERDKDYNKILKLIEANIN